MIPTLAQICSLPSPLEADVADYAAGQCHSLELWFTKLENYLTKQSIAQFKALLAEHNMTAPVVSYQGGLLDTQGDKRRESWDLLLRRLDLCAELEIKTIVIAADTTAPFDQQALDRVQFSLTQIAHECGRRQLRGALEFQASARFCNNLQTAVALVNEVGSPHLGICLDSFHFACGPSKEQDLGYLTTNNLFHVQLCDLTDVPREFATDSQRILPGDGDLPLATIVHCLKSIGYAGTVAIELQNPQLWQVPPRQFGEIAMTSLRRILGLASMQ